METPNNILRWVEPQGRTMDEIHRSTDTGFCNRIFYWEGLQLLNKVNNYSHKILVDKKYWPELIELIELPNTEITDFKPDYSFTPITNKLLSNIKLNNFKIENKNYYSNFDYQSLSEFDSILDKNRPIVNIKLQDKFLESAIKDFCKDKIGLHMRRGRGIIYGQMELESLPDHIRTPYIKFREKEGIDTPKYYIYEFVTDSTYFNIIDKILELNKNQKFYISHDVPDEFIQYYEEKYVDKIYTKTYFYNHIKNKFKNTDINHVKNVIDLFALSNTKMILKHPLSTWSEFGQYHVPKPAVYTTEDIDNIIELVKNII